MSDEFRDKLRSLQFNTKGRTQARSRVVDGKKQTQILHEGDGADRVHGGKVAAITTEHASGRVDAQVFPKSATAIAQES